MKDGRHSRRPLKEASGLLNRALVGAHFGSLTIVSRVTEGKQWNLRVEVQCARCGKRHMALYHNIRRRPNTKACPHCNGRERVTVPKWIYRRCQGQMARCVNSRNPDFRRYGGRGIEFRFKSVNAATRWIAENLGIPDDRSMQLDRIDNEGHYEPGNLRWANQIANMNNTRKSGARDRFIKFRIEYPHVRYADRTLNTLILRGMSFEEIEKRWKQPSCKPKGKYGTFSTRGPYRGSQRTGV